MSSLLPLFVPAKLDAVCQQLCAVTPPLGVSDMGARLYRLARAVGDPSMSNPVEAIAQIDPFGLLEGLSDVELSGWWSADDPWPRRAVWAAAAMGRVAAVDWLTWLVHQAVLGGAPGFASLVASDLRDVSRVALYSRCGTNTDLLMLTNRSPVRVFQWLQSIDVRIARTAETVSRPTGSRTATGVWLNGQLAGRDDRFDALQQASLMGGTPVVVEFDDGLRRHALVPLGLLDADDLDADCYCVDLVCRRGGWLSRFDRWIWDDESAEQLPPISLLADHADAFG